MNTLYLSDLILTHLIPSSLTLPSGGLREYATGLWSTFFLFLGFLASNQDVSKCMYVYMYIYKSLKCCDQYEPTSAPIGTLLQHSQEIMTDRRIDNPTNRPPNRKPPNRKPPTNRQTNQQTETKAFVDE